MNRPTIDEIRAWVESRRDFINTHADNCWKWHADCLAVRLLDHIHFLEVSNKMLVNTVNELEDELATTRNERDCQ